ncbi:MAG: hypothetical protein HN583_05935 [Kordiimonadaceae bacterium]|jgi:hypothetical protein|nr:hypothetical protein [Kordiimonadaceae bacterium]MDC0081375.1 DUF6282 family protein [Emcibacteraceae bacterium]MBT6135100.1 hypothetical protein [Kordiimonadaceae bacterium]MBT6466262.1 hypothetical protein [Kordiimonadaceae bacterium]MBT7544971.1 hypothetical protein [Kordiimonadaceae bacterium]|tara:strand:- start:5194 stop:6156 length:963 start_codon:yes stop_codon:yes gene_type:complete
MVKNIPNRINSSSDQSAVSNYDDALLNDILIGAVDLHCHSGPSVMPRCIDHIQVMKEGAAAKMKAILIKDHYYSATPVTELLMNHFQELGVQMLSGVPLNNSTGGINRFAVDHGIKLGAKLIWMPTFSSRNHIAHHKSDKDFEKKFPTTKEKMLTPVELGVLDDNGRLLDEVKFILDMIAEADIVLSGGHLHISEIFPLFEEAKKRGVKKLLVNHPSYLIDATEDEMRELVTMGAYLEHSMCMFVPGSKFHFYSPKNLDNLIKAGTVDRTILGSDLGQVGNPTPIEGFKNVIATCLDLNYSQTDIKKMISGNASDLLGLD